MKECVAMVQMIGELLFFFFHQINFFFHFESGALKTADVGVIIIF